MVDPRLIQPALEAARKALRLLDEEHVPAGLRRVVAASGRRLPKPLENSLIDHLDRLEWLRAKATEHLGTGEDGQDSASRLFLVRPERWTERIAEMGTARSDADAGRMLESAEATNARLTARLAALAEEVRAAGAEADRLRFEARAGAERARLTDANRDLRARLEEAEKALAGERRRFEELERLLAEADRRINELRRRNRARPEGQAPVAQVFGAGDPLALARSLDHLVESLARSAIEAPAEPVGLGLALPAGLRPDQAAAIEWVLSVTRPVTMLIDGYNIGHELAPIPDAGVRLRVEQIAARLRRMAEGAMTVVVFWDSRTDTGGWRTGGVDVRYVPSADHAIIEQSGAGTVVVSSDRAVREAAERRGAIGLWSEALLSWMS